MTHDNSRTIETGRLILRPFVLSDAASGNVILKCGFRFECFGQYSRYDGSETFDASFYRMRLD